MLVFVLKSAAFVSDQSHQANSFHTLCSHNFKDIPRHGHTQTPVRQQAKLIKCLPSNWRGVIL